MANRQKTQEMLDFTCKMWDDPNVYHYQDVGLIDLQQPSVFLAGPSSRDDVLSFKWRSYATHYLRKHGFTGGIVVPEPRNDDWSFKETFPTTIVQWESSRLLKVNIAMFWVPRHQTQLPGRVTNMELGFLAGMAYVSPNLRKRLVWGYPLDAWKVKSEEHWVKDIAGFEPFHDLEDMCQYVAEKLK